MKKSLIAATAVAIAAAAAPAFAATTEVVRESDVAQLPENTAPTKPWVAYARNAGAATFDGAARESGGSLKLTTPTGIDKITLFGFAYAGTPLDDLTALSYSTNRAAGQLQQVAALNVQVDANGSAAGGFTTLVFEPVYNTEQGAVVDGIWQTWDAVDRGEAIWWSSNPIPGAPDRDTFVSLDAIRAANPDAVIAGGLGVNQGSGNPGLTTSVDALTVNDKLYDFEPDLAYTLSAFGAPIDAGLNSAKAGQTIPVKVRVTDADGNAVTTDPGLALSFTAGGDGCAGAGAADALEVYAASESTWTHTGDGWWQFNYKTPRSWAGQCRTLEVSVDGDATVAGFQLR